MRRCSACRCERSPSRKIGSGCAIRMTDTCTFSQCRRTVMFRSATRQYHRITSYEPTLGSNTKAPSRAQPLPSSVRACQNPPSNAGRSEIRSYSTPPDIPPISVHENGLPLVLSPSPTDTHQNPGLQFRTRTYPPKQSPTQPTPPLEPEDWQKCFGP
jgi:hypothetical protein